MTIDVMSRNRFWPPWVRIEEHQTHLRDDADVHARTSSQLAEILTVAKSTQSKIADLEDLKSAMREVLEGRELRRKFFRLSWRALGKLFAFAVGLCTILAGLAAVFPDATAWIAHHWRLN